MINIDLNSFLPSSRGKMQKSIGKKNFKELNRSILYWFYFLQGLTTVNYATDDYKITTIQGRF